MSAERSRPPGTCWARGDWGDRCTEPPWHDYAHYDASSDTSWTDHTEDHADDCTCDVCQPDDSLPERSRR
jgi:hypothetical protein